MFSGHAVNPQRETRLDYRHTATIMEIRVDPNLTLTITHEEK